MNNKLSFLADAEMVDISVVEDIVEGRHPIPVDLDMATKLYIEEIVRMAKVNPLNFDRKPVISSKSFVSYWLKVNEHTQSSVSGHHYGTYKAAARDETGSEAHALQLTLIARSGVYPVRWGTTIQVLLRQGDGPCNIENMRYLNLYDAQFNCYKHFIVGGEAMETMTNFGLLPEVHFSKNRSTTVDAKLDTEQMQDICRQSMLPMAIISIDAVQWYDRVNHAILIILWAAILKNALIGLAILQFLQMKVFLQRTRYGDSHESYGRRDSKSRWMGIGQGSRCASHGWVQNSSVKCNVMKNTGLGAVIENPINHDKTHFLGSAFVW